MLSAYLERRTTVFRVDSTQCFGNQRHTQTLCWEYCCCCKVPWKGGYRSGLSVATMSVLPFHRILLRGCKTGMENSPMCRDAYLQFSPPICRRRKHRAPPFPASQQADIGRRYIYPPDFEDFIDLSHDCLAIEDKYNVQSTSRKMAPKNPSRVSPSTTRLPIYEGRSWRTNKPLL